METAIREAGDAARQEKGIGGTNKGPLSAKTKRKGYGTTLIGSWGGQGKKKNHLHSNATGNDD